MNTPSKYPRYRNTPRWKAAERAYGFLHRNGCTAEYLPDAALAVQAPDGTAYTYWPDKKVYQKDGSPEVVHVPDTTALIDVICPASVAGHDDPADFEVDPEYEDRCPICGLGPSFRLCCGLNI